MDSIAMDERRFTRVATRERIVVYVDMNMACDEARNFTCSASEHFSCRYLMLEHGMSLRARYRSFVRFLSNDSNLMKIIIRYDFLLLVKISSYDPIPTYTYLISASNTMIVRYSTFALRGTQALSNFTPMGVRRALSTLPSNPHIVSPSYPVLQSAPC
nr:hypothetical protein CFP56_77372 [Quercus suber]